MAMSENDFYLLNGNRFRGSRYANFTGAGVDPQGNVSAATNEDAANNLGTSADATKTSVAPGTALKTNVSSGLVAAPAVESAMEAPSFGQAAKDLVIGSAVPYAGKAIGTAAGGVLASGGNATQALSQGFKNVSSGLLSNAGSTATNSALASMGGKFGPATSSAVTKAAGGAGLGGAAGAGIGTAVATLLTGGSVKDAAKAGAGSAIGTYIGTAIGGPIGGFIGGTIGSFFCFAPDTPILMKDGSRKPVSEIELGDEVLGGGMVTAHGKSFADDLYQYRNTVVTGGHAVFENGKWLRVEESELAVPIPDDVNRIVCPVETEHRLLVTPWFVSADISEIPGEVWDVTETERISILNDDLERNSHLLDIERKYCVVERTGIAA